MTITIRVLLACLVAGSAAAQESKVPPPPPLWSGKAEVAFLSTSGNTDTQTIGAAGEVEYQPGVWSGKAKVAYIRSEANGEENAQSFLALLRGARKLIPRLEAYALGGYLKNTFSGIDRRLGGEVGLAYELVASVPHSLKVETGLGYTKEDRVVGPNRSFTTGRVGILYKWKFSKNAEFSNETSFTEDLKDSSDWRFADSASLSAGVTSILSLKASWTITKLNEPPPGFKKTDTITSAALVAKF